MCWTWAHGLILQASRLDVGLGSLNHIRVLGRQLAQGFVQCQQLLVRHGGGKIIEPLPPPAAAALLPSMS
jgi:hypothetical protein